MLIYHRDRYRIGFLGGAVSIVVTYTLLFIFLSLYAYFKAPRDTWAGMSLDIFRDLGIVARYGSASIAGVCSEWYAFEICSLASAYLGPTSQASIAIMMTVMGCMWTFPSSLGTATAIRVGNLLGEGRPKTAKTSARAAQYGVGLLMLVQCSLLFLLRTAIGRLYSHDESVITIVNATVS